MRAGTVGLQCWIVRNCAQIGQGWSAAESLVRSSCQRMLYARLESDVDQTEDAELRRLEAGASDATGHGLPASAGGTAEESAERAKTTGHHPLTDGQVQDARQALVTGYAEYRASLQDKKQYRRAIKIDLKLPEAAAALAGPPRRKEYAEGEEGKEAWKAAFNAYAGDFAYSHVGTETVKRRMGCVGMWGDYCEREGHGKYVEWTRKKTGTLKNVVVPLRDAATGKMKVSDAESASRST